MSAMGWQVVRVLPRGEGRGPVWLVQRVLRTGRQLGYFKFASPQSRQYLGPALASELIATRLARALRLPVAPVQIARIRGQTGLVSIVPVSRGRREWGALEPRVHGNIGRHVIGVQQIHKAFVFDVWIANIDRHGGNIIAYRRGAKYDFYLIDQALSLLAAARYRRKPLNSPYWNNIRTYRPVIPPGINQDVHRARASLNMHARSIQRLPTALIRRAVVTVPAAMLSPAQKRDTLALLLRRRRLLGDILRRSLPPDR